MVRQGGKDRKVGWGQVVRQDRRVDMGSGSKAMIAK